MYIDVSTAAGQGVYDQLMADALAAERFEIAHNGCNSWYSGYSEAYHAVLDTLCLTDEYEEYKSYRRERNGLTWHSNKTGTTLIGMYKNFEETALYTVRIFKDKYVEVLAHRKRLKNDTPFQGPEWYYPAELICKCISVSEAKIFADADLAVIGFEWLHDAVAHNS